MIIKDYYKILEVSPAASPLEIKKSFRRLAHKYHPDKNAGNSLYELKFKEINEAYRVLSDTIKRTEYNNTRKRPTQTNTKTYTDPVTAATILQQSIKLRTRLAAADPNRLDTVLVFQQVKQVLCRPNLFILKRANNAGINEEVIENIMVVGKLLPYSDVQKMIKTLVQMAGTNNNLLVKLRAFERNSKFNTAWNDYKVIIALLMAFVFSIFIYLLST